METKPNRFFALLGIAGITLAGLTACSSDLSEDDAKAACHEEVTGELNDPLSAEFDNDYTTATSTGKNHYDVVGKGRAANAFGGMVGFDFSCKVLKTSGGEVKVSTKIVDPWDD